jgi:hypothetical protein
MGTIKRREKSELLPAVRIEAQMKEGELYFNILRERVRNFNPKATTTNSRIKEMICKILSCFHTPEEGKKLLCSFPVEGDPYVLDIIQLYHNPFNHICYTFPKDNYDVAHTTFSLMRAEEIMKYGSDESFIIIDRDLDEWCHRKTMELYLFHRAGTSNYNYDNLKPFFEKYRTMIKKIKAKLCSSKDITQEEISSIVSDDSIEISPPEVYPDSILKRRHESSLYIENQKHKSSLDIIVDHLILNGEVVDDEDDYFEELSDNEKGKEVVKRLTDITTSSIDEKLSIVKEAVSHRKAEGDSIFNSISTATSTITRITMKNNNNKQNMKKKLISSDLNTGVKRKMDLISKAHAKFERSRKYIYLKLEQEEEDKKKTKDVVSSYKDIMEPKTVIPLKTRKDTGRIETAADVRVIDTYS